MYTVTTPISTSTKKLEEDASILKELSRKYSTEQLIKYLKEQKQVKKTNKIIIKQKLLKTRNFDSRRNLKMESSLCNIFRGFPPEDWSYNHYISWTDKNMNKKTINRTFYKTLKIMDNDQNISQGIHNVIQGFLKKKSDVNKSTEEKQKNIDYTDSKAMKKVKKEPETLDTVLKELKNTNAKVMKNVTEKSNTNLKVFEKTLLKFFKPWLNFSLSSASEVVLQVIAELLLQENQILGLLKLCLVIDNNKPRENSRFGFVDLIFGGLNPSVIELKYINLSGLIKAMNNDWNSYSSTNLASLDKYIENEDEKTSLKQKY
ncbi:42432_t:CDS:2, partial [Gigaspora margarita]